MKEGVIQTQILEYLRLLENQGKLYYTRLNSTGVFDPTKKVFRRPSPHQKHGIPDIMVIKDNKIIFLECKSETGKQSEYQKAFEEICKSNSQLYYVVRSLDEVRDII